MSYIPTQNDFNLLLQGVLKTKVKIEIINEDETIYGELVGAVSGDNGIATIDSTSHARRQFSFTLVPTNKSIKMAENSLLWIDKEAFVYIGIYSFREEKYYWYKFGKFIFAQTTGTYDAINNSISISCIDEFAKLNGTQNGQFGSLVSIPAYEEDESGNPTTHNTISEAVISILKDIGNVKKYSVDEIGEYKGIEQYNSDWENYRSQHVDWNYLPYDLEFSRGTMVSNMLDEPINLYPNWDYYFDEDGVFNVKMIPSSYDNSVLISYNYLKKILVAYDTESVSITPTSVRNVCEVWGQVIDTDYYSETVSTSSSTYNVTCEGYSAYQVGDKIGIKVSSNNVSSQKIKVNSLSAIAIYDESTDAPLAAGVLKSGEIYSFKYRNRYINGSFTGIFYYLGQWEVHALNVLTDGTVITNGYTDSTGTYDKYSKEYFKAKYNCNNVVLNTIPDSPFTVQKIGERVDVKSGDEYENITSDSLAQSRAEYENWKNCRLPDTITIKTLLIPWLSEYQKIEYKTENEDTPNQYITQKIDHDPSSGMTTIQAYRFYPLYQES